MLLRRAKCQLSRRKERVQKPLLRQDSASSLKGSPEPLTHCFVQHCGYWDPRKTWLYPQLREGPLAGDLLCGPSSEMGNREGQWSCSSLLLPRCGPLPLLAGIAQAPHREQNNHKSLHFAFVSFLLYLYPVYLKNFRCWVEHGTWSQD